MSFRITYSVLDADLGEIRRQFAAALRDARAGRGRTFPSWVAGEPFESGDLLESRNPADTRELLARLHRADAAALERAVDAAHDAQRRWARTPWRERAALLRRAADIVSERRLALAAAMTLEVGKVGLESLGDVEEAADLMRYYAAQLEEANGYERPLGRLAPNEDTRSVLKPYGVFAVVSPFNFPAALAAGMSSAALLGGNAVILKPAEQAPWCAQLLYEACRDAGLPRGLLQVLHGEGEGIGRALVRQGGIDGVAFTGSAAVGREILRVMSGGDAAAAARPHARPALLELGGKNAAIVCASADLDAAAEGCLRSAFGLSGQKCSALSRIVVARERYDEFVEKLLRRARAAVVGDPARDETFVGPVIDAAAVERYERACAEARRDGSVLCGGARLGGAEHAHGRFVAPTVAALPRGHRLLRDELFLPFVAVMPCADLDEAIAIANDADYGLTAGIYSALESEIDAFMDRVEAGVLYANRRSGATTGAWPGVQSFCGWKASGASGKGGCGPWYVPQFMREQSQTRMR